MRIFISWSGARSAAAAEALKEYLPMINNAFDPWLSSSDIPKGSRSTGEIADALASAKAGIICLTPSNLTAPWILYEAGGIAKTVDRPLACTLLIGLGPSDVGKPLGDFQHTPLREKELLKLMKDLNNAAGESARQETEIDKAFKLCWPELGEKLKNLPEDGPAGPKRSERDLLNELLDITRQMSLSVLESHRLIMQKLVDLEARQGYLDTMVPLSSLLPTAADVLGGAGASAKSTDTLRAKKFQHAVNYSRLESITPEDKPKKK